MVTQPDTILHLDGLEEAGAKTEKPDQAWSRSGSCLPMEPEQKRRVGNCTKPDSEHDHNGSKTHPAGLRTVADPLLQSKSTLPKFTTIWLLSVAEVSHCLANRRIRDPYVRWCVRLSPSVYLAGQSTRLAVRCFFCYSVPSLCSYSV